MIILKKYCIGEQFGGDNVWRKWMDKAFGEKSLANEQIEQKVINCNY